MCELSTKIKKVDPAHVICVGGIRFYFFDSRILRSLPRPRGSRKSKKNFAIESTDHVLACHARGFLIFATWWRYRISRATEFLRKQFRKYHKFSLKKDKYEERFLRRNWNLCSFSFTFFGLNFGLNIPTSFFRMSFRTFWLITFQLLFFQLHTSYMMLPQVSHCDQMKLGDVTYMIYVYCDA